MSKTDTTTFALQIETLAKDKKISYIDAVMNYCETHDMEVEVAAKLIAGSLKSKIENEASNLHMIKLRKRRKKLPL